jgi:hypothetical protein
MMVYGSKFEDRASITTLIELPSFGTQGLPALGGTVRDVEQTEVSKGYEVLFPVAVGGVFLIVLVVGALVG